MRHRLEESKIISGRNPMPCDEPYPNLLFKYSEEIKYLCPWAQYEDNVDQNINGRQKRNFNRKTIDKNLEIQFNKYFE